MEYSEAIRAAARVLADSDGVATVRTDGGSCLAEHDFGPEYYTTDGSVRGSCGHKHKSPRTAQECLERDNRGCRRQCGPTAYSDRAIVRSDGLELTDAEWEEALS